MAYMWWGFGIGLLVALGTILFQNIQTPQLEYKRRDDDDETSSATSAAADNSSRRSQAPQGEENCVICLTEVRRADKEYLPCFHFFHSKCVQNWMRYNKICPVCRTRIDVRKF